jgi:hypothetical protein
MSAIYLHRRVDAMFLMLFVTRTFIFWRFPHMTRTIRITVLAFVAAAIAACATAPAPDLTPPARKPSDAKTQLESKRY